MLKQFLLVSIFIILAPMLVSADDLSKYKFCFSAKQTQNLVVDLDGSTITEEIFKQCKDLNSINEKIIKDYKKIELKLNEQIVADADTIKNMDELNKEERKMCDERVEAMKPSFKEKSGWFLSGAGMGSLLTLLAILLL